MRIVSMCFLPARRDRARWAIAFALVVAASAPTAAHAQMGIVVGKVTDKTTGEPLAGTTVEIRGTQLGAATDGRGHYLVRGVRPGPAQVTARRLGFRPTSQTLQVV